MRKRSLLVLFAALAIMPTTAATQSAALTTTDHVEIQQLYALYTYAFDSSDPKLLPSVFTADAEFVMGTNRMKALTMVKGPAKPRPEVRHVVSSIVVNASAEGARGSAYVTLVNLQATPPTIMGGGFYEDVLVKTPDGWRFKTRTFNSQTTPAAAAK